MNATLRALNRFGLGARVGEADRIDDPRNWLKSQLDPSRTGIQATHLPSLEEVGSALRQTRQSQNTNDEETRKKARQGLQQIAGKETSAALQQRITTETPFLERLVAFWSNHLCVSAQAKPQVLSLAGHYERDVIRPHVLGRFSDMVLASARHPAMLFYLDNARSIGPSSRGSQMAARRGRERGLNENYARELNGTTHRRGRGRIHSERCRTAGSDLHRLDGGRAGTGHGHGHGGIGTTSFHVPDSSP